jgi:secretion/DNA translocation related TadE-like protein
MTHLHDERGLAAPVVVALTGLLLVLTGVGAGCGRLLVDQRRAAAAADLAALAGASALQWGREPCTEAREAALRNGASLLGCRQDGPKVRVTAGVRSPLTPAWTVTVRADALAGPVTG